MAGNGLKQAIQITLRGRYNLTYTGTLVLRGNLTSRFSSHIETESENASMSANNEEEYDATGASYYVIAVVLVYGMSIVALIASHIKRRNEKIAEDKQIDKYLQDFQIIKEVHARDSYKNLKKSVMKKINWDRKKETHRSIQQSILPLLAIGVQVGSSKNSSMESINEPQSKGKHKVYPAGTKRHRSDPDLSDVCTKLIETVNDPKKKRFRRHSHIDATYNSHFGNTNSESDVQHLSPQGSECSPGHRAVPEPHLLNVGYGTITNPQASENATARRLRFSSSAQLDRSLNSIAEGEEEEKEQYAPPIPPRGSISITTQSSGDSASYIDNTPVSRLSKLRQIGVTLTPCDDPPQTTCLLPHPPLPDSGSNPTFSFEDADAESTEPSISCPRLIVPDDGDDDDDVWLMEVNRRNSSPPPTPRRSYSITPRSLSLVPPEHMQDNQEEECLSPGTLLDTIKNTNPSAFIHNKSMSQRRRASFSSFSFLPSSRRNSCRSPILGHRGSKGDTRASSSSTDLDRTIEASEDNPLQITCV